MLKVVGIKFPYTLKIYDFLPGNLELKPRDFVVVETTQGTEVGEIVYVGKSLSGKAEDFQTVRRLAKRADLEKTAELREKARELRPIFEEKITKHGLPMSPVDVCYSLDESKAIFYFTSDGRVDFRELAKDLSRSIQKQAVMRQIGPRDEAKLIGGFGRCGREICCATFLLGTESVSKEVIESQFGGPKNINKITGICGRLMCCLNYEAQEVKNSPVKNISEKVIKRRK